MMWRQGRTVVWLCVAIRGVSNIQMRNIKSDHESGY